MNKIIKHHRTTFWVIGLSAIIAGLAGWIWMSPFSQEQHPQDAIDPIEKNHPGPDMRPSDWAWQRRTYPHGKADVQSFRKAVQSARQMRSRAAQRPLQSVQPAGPTNVGGRIVDIEFNPQDPTVVYAAAASGGVFKSTDTGNSWVPVFDDAAILTIGDIGIDPNDPETVYVGTGEANGGHNNFAGGGMYKSTNGGESWQYIGLEETVSIGRVIVDPSNSQRVFVAAVGSYFGPNPERGVYRSSNGGTSWENVLFVSDSTGAIDLAIDPANPSRMMAAMWERVRPPDISAQTHLYGPTSGIHRSSDGGDSWERLGPANGLPNPNSQNVGRIGISLHAANADIGYAFFTNGSNYLGFYKTTDFGSSWSNADSDREISNGIGGFSWYFGQVRVHPTNPDIVFALDQQFMRSTNSGDNWSIIFGSGFHVDHHALAFHPTDPSYIVEGNDGGINISTDTGVNWTKVADLPVTQFYEIGLDANNPQRLYGGTQDNGTLRTLSGALDDWGRIYGGDGFYVIVDHSNPNVIYAESQFGNLGKSTNGGSSFSGATSGISGNTNWSTPVVMDPNNNTILYYGAERIFRTVNAAGSWSAISPVLHTSSSGSRLNNITTIGVSPANSNVIWAGTADSHVWVTSDFGNSWSDVSATLPNRWVTRIIPHPQNETVAYATFNGLRWVDPEARVFRTTDRGATWENISANLPDAPVNAFDVYVDKNSRNYLFAGSDLGAYLSTDDGQSWEYLSSDLPMVSVYDIKVHPTADYLAIGTHARSMYKLDLSQVLVGLADPDALPLSDGFALQQNYPNPFNPSTTIAFRLDSPARVNLSIFDVLGRRVQTLSSGYMPAGTHSLQWDGRNEKGQQAGSGSYFYRLEVDGRRSQVKQMVLER